MSEFSPDILLAGLVLSVSRHLAQQRIDASALRPVVEEIRRAVGAQRVQITIRPSKGRLGEALEAEVVDSKWGPAFVLFARSIETRGVAYGHFSVAIARPAGSPATAILALESVVHLLALAAERAALEESVREARRQAGASQASLARARLLARAGGIVSVLRRVPQHQAEQWIGSEAARLKLAPEVLAERVLECALTRTAGVGEQRPAPGLPALRRTA